jgi:hypothetical protein
MFAGQRLSTPEPHTRKEPVMRNRITYVGLDAHKATIQVAMLIPDQKPVEWQIQNEPAAVRRLAKRLLKEGTTELSTCYEAGPCGYTLQRQLNSLGVACQVIAPSLIPVKPGDRIKTDRRDARKLAELLRAGLLTEVHPPTAEEEAVRDLCRAREDETEDCLRCRHRLGKMLLRRGLIWGEGKKAWTAAHRQWLKSLRWDHEADQAVFEDYLLALEQAEERIKSLDMKLETQAHREPYREPVAWLPGETSGKDQSNHPSMPIWTGSSREDSLVQGIPMPNGKEVIPFVRIRTAGFLSESELASLGPPASKPWPTRFRSGCASTPPSRVPS